MGSPKSKNIHDKPVFEERFLQCPQKIRKIFNELRDRAISGYKSDDWGYSDKPDLRIGLKYNMIEFVPKSKYVLVMLRVDKQPPEVTADQLTTISLSEAKESGKPGSRWVEFQVSENNQINDAIQLIQSVYSGRKQIGW